MGNSTDDSPGSGGKDLSRPKTVDIGRDVGEAAGDMERGGVSGTLPLDTVQVLCAVRPRESDSGREVSGKVGCSSCDVASISLFLRPSLAASLSTVDRREDVGDGTMLDGAVCGVV